MEDKLFTVNIRTIGGDYMWFRVAEDEAEIIRDQLDNLNRHLHFYTIEDGDVHINMDNITSVVIVNHAEDDDYDDEEQGGFPDV